MTITGKGRAGRSDQPTARPRGEHFQHSKERHEHSYAKNDEIKQKLEKYKGYKTYSTPAWAAT